MNFLLKANSLDADNDNTKVADGRPISIADHVWRHEAESDGELFVRNGWFVAILGGEAAANQAKFALFAMGVLWRNGNGGAQRASVK